jgi:cysteine desulfurase / selenocysteine lyase
VPIDVARARRETPGCAHAAHFNSAGAALPPQVVLDTVIDHLKAEATVGGYPAERAAAQRIEAVYGSIARLLGCNRSEVAVVENATRAWDMAFYGIRFRPGDRILTAKAEYASNVIAFLQVARHTDVSVEVVPDDESGQLSVEALARMIDERVRLIAISHVPTHGGLVNPAADVGRIAREAGVMFLLDACQSVGQMPVDVGAIGCHMLSATGRKFLRGPRGTGFLYVSKSALDEIEPPFLDLHAATWTSPWDYAVRPDARRFETWEGYVAGKLGLGAAIDYALGWGLENIEARISQLATLLRDHLTTVAGVRLHDLGIRRCGIVTFTKDGWEPEKIVEALAARGIVVDTSSARASQFDLPLRGLTSLVRASVHYYNTEGEIEALCEAVRALGGNGGAGHPATTPHQLNGPSGRA